MNEERNRPLGALLAAAIVLMVAGAAIVVPAGLTLNPADTAATLAAVRARPGLHLLELGLDVLGWLALTTAGLALAARELRVRPGVLVPAGLLALAGAAGLLHDAGNLAVTQLAAAPDAVPAAQAVLLTAKWSVNLAGLLWTAATAAAALVLPLPEVLRRIGAAAAVSGLAAVVLPWTAGTAGPGPALEQVGYALHLPVLAWWAVLAWRWLR
ncbi:hypothetical protein SAMN05216298_2920 [Glycomyces sambucus]|uniref:DUF4386 domain-containing protein n=1 Tax=Glycomyces sambucus TaxID=380244 RepID=A0A1G9HZD9_9ACTN|nr:hypothetical protein [Glycomyces sambucus]SDL18034.1 hypothetical protein SAMN05216298_2920 [Glycomyces sambucus]